MAAVEQSHEMALEVYDAVADSARGSLDVAKALKLRIQGCLSYEEIGKVCGVTKQSVHRALQPFLNMVSDPEARKAYQENKSAVLEGAQMKVVSRLADDQVLEKASVNNLAYAAQSLDNMIRLDRGESTSNIATYSMMSRESSSIDEELEALQGQLAHVSPASGPSDTGE